MSALHRKLHSLLLWLVDFPCPLCGAESSGTGSPNGFCPDCLARLPFLHGPRCPGCGGEIDGVLKICPKCLAMPPRPWRRAMALLAMRDSGQEVIYRLKFHGMTVMARSLSELAAPLLSAPEFSQSDLIVPVPLHRFRLWTRNYNQSELLGRMLGKKLRIPCRNALKRVRPTRRQATLDREARLKNLKGAFQTVRPEWIAGKKILLVDDVLTTGATLHAAAEELLKAGAAEVNVFVAARR